MPPKPKFTREEIVAAALQVVRTRGLEALTTREIAAELGTSTRPIFTYFESMEQVRAEVRKAAEKIYLDTIEEGLSKPWHRRAHRHEQLPLYRRADQPHLHRLQPERV